MSAGSFKTTDKFRLEFAKGTVDFDTDVFFHVLLTASHTFARSNGLFSNISGNEVAGGGDYARLAMAGATVANVSGKIVFKSNEANFGAQVDIAAKFHAIVHAANGTSLQSTDIVVGMRDLNTEAPGTDGVSSDDGPFISRPHATDGWFYIDVPA